TPPALVPTVDKADEMILQDTLQVSLAEHKSQEEQEARENVELVNEHLASVEIEKMVEGLENVIDDSLILRNDESNIPGTRLEPRSDKESSEVEIIKDKEVEPTNNEEVEITNVIIPVNVNDEEEEITDEVYELKRREKGKIVEESRSTPFPTPIRSPKIHTDLVEISSQIHKAIDNHIPSQVDALVRSYMSGHILHVHPVQSQTPYVLEQQYQLYLSMKFDPQFQQQDIAIWLALQMKFKSLQGENHAKRQKTYEYEVYVSRELSSGQVNENEQGPLTSGNQEQEDDYDFWTESYASDDDEIPTKQMSQDIIELSLTIDEAKLKKMVDEMLRQRCTSVDEHQYHIDQMKNFLKSDIVWESRKEIIIFPHPRKTTPLVQSCQRDHEAPPLSLINQDLLYLNKGSLGPENIVLSLHKFLAIIFNNDDIQERTSRWVNKCVKKFNPYARYGVEHWKNPHAKILYIRKQKEPGKPKEKVNLTAPAISFPGVEKHKMFSIIYEPVHGIIYKNNKKEKRVMRHSEIHKFCDATLNRVLEGLRSYNNDVKYGYIQRDLTNEEVEYLKLFEEEIEVILKYQN
ncbi:hypothetical protein Tco_0986411, partial [Tanacetum coccineum]